MLTIPTYVAASTIPGAGLGLFAKGDIKAGTIIWRYDPGLDVVLHELPSNPVFRNFVLKYGYVPLEGEYRWVLCIDDGRFMNHSDTPTTYDTAEHTITVRDLPAGTELTSDYRTFCREPFTAWYSTEVAEASATAA
jgi:uncharacterized protein